MSQHGNQSGVLWRHYLKKVDMSHTNNQIVMLGICCDENSSHLKGTAKAPPLIRKALHNGSANFTAENGISLADSSGFTDIGDFEIATGKESFMAIEEKIAPILQKGNLPLTLGADHAITYPIMRALLLGSWKRA